MAEYTIVNTYSESRCSREEVETKIANWIEDMIIKHSDIDRI